ncbi:MAG: hypothetical protein COA79_24785 [Planctomycetota bacterium]|nr:MAG: hypothetical protein COA79_24785 [Planctomycetota bacterium]
MNGYKVGGISIAIIFFFYYFLLKENKQPDINSTKNKPLMIYCAAGIKEPFEMAVKEFKKVYSIDITVDYRGSGHLYGSLKTSSLAGLTKGDLFLAADYSYTDMGKKDGIIKETLPLAYQNPILIVKKGNPKNIKSIHDLLKPHIKIVIANPEAASVGKTTKKILSKAGLWKQINENVIKYGTFKPTVLDVANDVKLGVMDAGIVWDPISKHHNYIDYIEVVDEPILTKHKKHITIGILTSSKNPTMALKFARFIHANDRGQQYFKHFNFQTINNADDWSEHPSIKLMSGGVNRIAIKDTLEEFKKREGVEIITVFNGCGILVSTMRGGERPDAYFACDISFVDQVKDLFKEPKNIAKTDIVIATLKNNPKNIKSIDDLGNKFLKLGVGHPDQSALGSLTVKLLKSMNIYEAIYKNVTAQTPSADMIVVQLLSGSLDAIIVYRANLSKLKDKFEVIEIAHKMAHAIQPFAIAKKTRNHYLIERLLDAIEEKSNRFESAGFSLFKTLKKNPFVEPMKK